MNHMIETMAYFGSMMVIPLAISCVVFWLMAKLVLLPTTKGTNTIPQRLQGKSTPVVTGRPIRLR